MHHDCPQQQLGYSTLYKNEQEKASEKLRKTLHPVALREAVGRDPNTEFVFLHMLSYWANCVNFVTNKTIHLRLTCLISFQDPVHFLQCSKGVKRLKYKVSGNKLTAALC